MLSEHQLVEALQSLPTYSAEGTIYRVISVKLMNMALSAIGSTIYGGRYNPRRSFETLYFSESPITALLEVTGAAVTDSQLAGFRGPARIVLSIDFSLEQVLDLTNEQHQHILDTNLQELLLPWRAKHLIDGTIAATQFLGTAAHTLGTIQALRVPSVRDPKTSNLIVFPERLKEPSFIRVYDDSGMINAKLP